MQREMRDISADLMERADLLQGQIDSAQARFQAVITELNKERAIQRQRLETEVQAVHRLIHVVSIQHALHRGLKSAVAALDNLGAAKVSGTEGKKENGEIGKRSRPQVSGGGSSEGEGNRTPRGSGHTAKTKAREDSAVGLPTRGRFLRPPEVSC
jgi:hypothetical protein